MYRHLEDRIPEATSSHSASGTGLFIVQWTCALCTSVHIVVPNNVDAMRRYMYKIYDVHYVCTCAPSNVKKRKVSQQDGYTH